MGEVIYFKGLYGKRSKYGIRLSGKAEDVIRSIREHTNAKGYINLEVKERREEGKYGDTHYVTVDTYEPQGRSQPPAQQAPAPPPPADPEHVDDLPF